MRGTRAYQGRIECASLLYGVATALGAEADWFAERGRGAESERLVYLIADVLDAAEYFDGSDASG
jgi:hypothetical protein